MKNQAINLFIFSFICFIGVIIFGSVLSPVKKSFIDTDIFRNISLFHNHFDQLCWLGSAAIGCTFWGLDQKYKGAEIALRIFAFSYMLGTLLFSFGFLFRAIGIFYDSSMTILFATIGLISFGGLLMLVTTVCALYIAICILSKKRTKRIDGVVTG